MIDIEIINITPEIQGFIYDIHYKVNRKERRFSILKGAVLKHILERGSSYEEGIRPENVEDHFTSDPSKYIKSFLSYFHDI